MTEPDEEPTLVCETCGEILRPKSDDYHHECPGLAASPRKEKFGPSPIWKILEGTRPPRKELTGGNHE